ncbi:hypothetical protein PAPYR_8552 [Paratrimastix pyriformis]|uniref:Uncharacterized protein n=1 Tax=Paratrimastix pyriformis TaxID=342808 RepID=A0ABQ8UD09_9EUKA|nr:hypothetical protein PAPYR_8552 [Paratrimastix pyriformis]
MRLALRGHWLLVAWDIPRWLFRFLSCLDQEKGDVWRPGSPSFCVEWSRPLTGLCSPALPGAVGDVEHGPRAIQPRTWPCDSILMAVLASQGKGKASEARTRTIFHFALLQMVQIIVMADFEKGARPDHGEGSPENPVGKFRSVAEIRTREQSTATFVAVPPAPRG